MFSIDHKKRTLTGPVVAGVMALVWTTLTADEAVPVLKQKGTSASLNAAVAATQYCIARAEPGTDAAYRADNPARAMRTYFTKGGIRMVPLRIGQEDGGVGLQLTGYGYGNDLEMVPEADLEVWENRIEYRRGSLTEWYVNDAHGLEQGFTLEAPPPYAGASRETRRLVLAMALSGDLEPVLSEDGTSVLFRDAAAQRVLRYGDLYALDARGRELPAQMEVREGRLRILVDDTAALYPIVIDPLVIDTDKLTASDAQPNQGFGQAVALSGDSVVVGTFSESAYVFVRAAPQDNEQIPAVATRWIEQAKLTASDAAPLDSFGLSVAIGGDTVVVGAPFNDDAGNASGSAYVFVRSGTTWTQQAKLTASDAAPSDAFGSSVGISGDSIVLGAPSLFGPGSGSAYVFVRSGTTWTQQAKLTASDAAAGDGFGFHVAISGDTVVVGAPRDDHSGQTEAGSAYIFQRAGTTWSQEAKLIASDAGSGDLFGGPTTSNFRGPGVAITGDTVVVGDGHESSSGLDPGSAYIFQRSGTSWTEEAKLTSTWSFTDGFGGSVGLSGEIVVVGELVLGSAYVFRQDVLGNWNREAKLTPRDIGFDSGWSVGISGGTVVVGDVGGFGETGSAYVFELVPPASGTGGASVPDTLFLRGDCNGDGQVSGHVADAVFLLQHSFSTGSGLPCLAACDVNGDGRVTGEVTDAVYLLQFNFLGGPAPLDPFPDCGIATLATDDTLGCQNAPCQ